MTAQIIYLNDFRIGSKKSTFKVLLRKNCHNRHVKRKPLFAIRSEFENILDNRQAWAKKPAMGSAPQLDVYAYPNLMLAGRGKKTRHKYVNSVRLLIPEVLAEGVLVEGGKKSGRTSLLFRLFRQYHARNYFPVLIRGRDLKIPTSSYLDALFKRTIEYQYGDEGIEAFFEYPQNQKLLLIDDFDYSSFALSNDIDHIDLLRERFGLLVMTVGNSYVLRTLLEAGIPEEMGWNHYKLLPLSLVSSPHDEIAPYSPTNALVTD